MRIVECGAPPSQAPDNPDDILKKTMTAEISTLFHTRQRRKTVDSRPDERFPLTSIIPPGPVDRRIGLLSDPPESFTPCTSRGDGDTPLINRRTDGGLTCISRVGVGWFTIRLGCTHASAAAEGKEKRSIGGAGEQSEQSVPPRRTR